MSPFIILIFIALQVVFLSQHHKTFQLFNSAGVYHCEMMDKNNITHYLYIGIYPENEGNKLRWLNYVLMIYIHVLYTIDSYLLCIYHMQGMSLLYQLRITEQPK